MKTHQARPEHEVAYKELAELIGRHGSQISALELLAVAANMVGKLIALQDQRAHSAAEIMELVAQNIELGNRQVIGTLAVPEGSKVN